MPMKAHQLQQAVDQAKKHYDMTKQAEAQIYILKKIALNGKQTKPQLASNPSHSYRTIDTTISRDGKNELDRDSYFKQNGSILVNGIKQKQYSLTSFGIIVLLRSRYKINKKNDQADLSGKPILSHKEFDMFLLRYDNDYDKKWELPVSSLSWIYYDANPTKTDQLISKFKDDKKLKNITSSIEDIKEKLKELEVKKIEKIHERYELLTNLQISSLKK